MTAPWDDVLTDEDREILSAAGYGERAGWGARPALLVIDVNYNFCGDRPEPALESVRRWRNSCGLQAWEAVERIATLIDKADERRVPVIYTTGQDRRQDGFDAGRWGDKNRRVSEDEASHPPGRANEIVPLIEPRPHHIVIRKGKPSAFFGTLLGAFLVDLQADSVIVCGLTTSGCVRATVVDAFSLNYRATVVSECTADRAELSHVINLFDMHQKYADVVELEETLHYLDGLDGHLFGSQFPALQGQHIAGGPARKVQ